MNDHRPRTMPHTRSVAPQKSQLEAKYLALRAELDEAKRMIRDVTEAHYTEYSRAETLLNWSRRAYNALDLIEPTADRAIVDFIRKILAKAPDTVKLPTIAELAGDLGVSEKELLEYAVESAGAPDSVKGGAK